MRFRPTLTVDVPDGWLVRESIELAAPDEGAYVTASVEGVDPDTTAEQVADRYRQAVAERLPEYEELAVERIELSPGRPAVVRKVRWKPPQDEPVAELQMYSIRAGRAIVATARGREASFDKLEPTLRDVLAATDVGVPSPSAGIVRRDGTSRTRTYDELEAGHMTTTIAEAFGLETAADDPEAETPWKEVRNSWARTKL